MRGMRDIRITVIDKMPVLSIYRAVSRTRRQVLTVSLRTGDLYPAESASGYSTRLFQMLVALMAIALMLTIVLGLVLAVRTLRPPWLVWLSLALRILAPVLCLWLGQQH